MLMPRRSPVLAGLALRTFGGNILLGDLKFLSLIFMGPPPAADDFGTLLEYSVVEIGWLVYMLVLTCRFFSY